MTRNTILALIVVGAIIGSVYAASQLGSISSQNEDVRVRIVGLPQGESVTVSTVNPLSGGGFLYINKSLSTLQDGQSANLQLQSFPVNLYASGIGFSNYTELAPIESLQEATHLGETITFTYVRQYEVGAGIGWSGYIGSRPLSSIYGGNVSKQGLFNATSELTGLATPQAGWMFLYWNVTSFVSSTYDYITTTNPFETTLSQPLNAFADFVPILYLFGTNGTKGTVTILNLSRETVDLVNSTGGIVASSYGTFDARLNVQNITQPFSGRFIISLQTGQVVYTSRIISGIESGDVFEF